MGRGARVRFRLLLAVALISTALGGTLYASDALSGPELDTVDLRFSVRGADAPPDDVAVVAVDDVTFAELGVAWPFPRRLHARLIDRLVAQGAGVIAYDVQFTEPTSPRDDNALIEAVRRATARAPVILSTTEVGRDGETNVFGGDQQVRWSGATVGNGNLITDPGGVIRRTPYRRQGLASFAVAAAESLGDVEAPRSEEGSAWIDYYGPPGTVPALSFSRVLTGDVPSDALRDRFVVVGATAPSLQDVHPTSVGGDQLMSGPEIQANAISTIREGVPLAPSPTWIDLLAIALMGLVAPAASLGRRALPALAIATLLAATAYLALAQIAFERGTILPVVAPLATLALAMVGALAVHYLTAAIERQRVRDAFARFVPERVVDQVLARADDGLRLGGDEVEGTILFADIRGFTTFSERHPADQVLEVLNRYLSSMSEAILDRGGTLTAYLGDGIMAVFGAPIPQDDHADRAVAAARAMLAEELPLINEWLIERGMPAFEIGIGLNTGSLMVGNVGSERRLEYTAIGDAVNTASRLEGMTKDTSSALLIADSTRELLEEPDGLEFVDEVAIRGRSGRVRVWTLPEARPRGAPQREPPEG